MYSMTSSTININDYRDYSTLIEQHIGKGKSFINMIKTSSSLSDIASFICNLELKIDELYEMAKVKKIEIVKKELLNTLKDILDEFPRHFSLNEKVLRSIYLLSNRIEDIKIEQIYSNLFNESETAKVYSKRAEVYFNLKEYHEAIHFYLKALNLNHDYNSPDIIPLVLALQRTKKTFLGHGVPIKAVFPLGNDKVIVGYQDGTLSTIEFDGNNRKWNCKNNIVDKISALTAINNTYIISGHENGSLILWNIAKEELALVLDKRVNHSIRNLVSLPNDRFITYDGMELTGWGINSNRSLFSHYIKGVTAIKVLSDGKMILGNAKGVITIFNDLNDFRSSSDVDTKYSKEIRSLNAIGTDQLIIGYSDGNLHQFSLKTLQCKLVENSSVCSAITALISYNEDYWISSRDDGRVKLWTLKENCTCINHVEADASVSSLNVDISGNVFIGCTDGTLHLWCPTLKAIPTFDDDSTLNLCPIDDRQLVRGEPIAKGNFGVVYKGHYKNNPVAIKELHTVAKNVKTDVANEVKILLAMRDFPSLLTLEGVAIANNEIKMVTELMEGTLEDLLKSTSTILWKDRWLLIMDIAYGVLGLHLNRIVHRDIKPANILIRNGRAKICDFGFSLLNADTIQLKGGTPQYIDPWYYKYSDERDSPKIDIYSLGVTIWEILNDPHKKPWGHITNAKTLISRLVDDDEKLKIADHFPHTMKVFLPTLWNRSRNARPDSITIFETIAKIKNEFLFKDFVTQNYEQKMRDLAQTVTVLQSDLDKQKQTHSTAINLFVKEKTELENDKKKFLEQIKFLQEQKELLKTNYDDDHVEKIQMETQIQSMRAINVALLVSYKTLQKRIELLSPKKECAVLEKKAGQITLNLSNTTIDDDQLELLSKRHPYLTHLDLSYCNHITNFGIAFLQNLAILKKLNLKGCNQINNAVIEYLTWIGNNGIPSVEDLGFSFNENISDNDLVHMLKLQNLSRLDIDVSCHSSDSEMAKFLKILTNLNFLKITVSNNDQCFLDYQTIKALNFLPHLTSLDLHLTWNDKMLECLAELSQLRELVINDCKHFEYVSDKGISNIGKLSQLSSLTINGFIPPEDEILAKSQNNTFNIEGCNYSFENFLFIESLKQLKNLTELSLSGSNQINDESIDKLATYLSGLTSLDLSHCKLSDKAINSLCKFKSLRVLNLQGCTLITSEGIKTLSSLSELEKLIY